MNGWTWSDTLWLGIVLVLWAFAHVNAQPQSPPVRYDFIPLDTVGCGVLERCEIKTMSRYMSHHPFAEGR
jgi:hypothetical protein